MNAHTRLTGNARAPVAAPKNFAEAFCQLQAVIKPAIKDSTNPAFRSKYADLGAVWEAVKQPLIDHGFAVIQAPNFDGDNMFLETTIMHTSGEYISGRYPIRPTKNDPQGYGSALTYARRYSISAMLGVIADDDDDGNAASAPAPKPAQQAATKIADEDVAAGARNWVDKQKDRIIAYSSMDELTNWLRVKASYGGREGNWDRPTPSSDLDKILKFSAPLYNELKNYYMEKMREV